MAIVRDIASLKDDMEEALVLLSPSRNSYYFYKLTTDFYETIQLPLVLPTVSRRNTRRRMWPVDTNCSQFTHD
jgi:hypothetical protein